MIDEQDQKFGVTLISWLVRACPFGMQATFTYKRPHNKKKVGERRERDVSNAQNTHNRIRVDIPWYFFLPYTIRCSEFQKPDFKTYPGPTRKF